jgi:Tfp pilus assembly protein PilX
LVIGGSRAAARSEVQRQQTKQEMNMNTQARLQWEAQQSAARDQQIAQDAAKAALAEREKEQAAAQGGGQTGQAQGSGRSRFCSNCGHRLPEGAKFCHDCGAQVQVQA